MYSAVELVLWLTVCCSCFECSAATPLLKMADLFCNSVGILQQSTVDGTSKNESGEGGGGEGSREPAPGDVPPEENIKLFSTLITRTAQDIDTLIDSLPSSEYTAEMQVC